MNLRKQLSSYIALNNYVEAFRENTSSIVLTDAITNGLTDLQLKGSEVKNKPEMFLDSVVAKGGTEQNGTPTPDTPMDIVSNNGVLKVRNKRGLPFGYTELEYIESTGTQYIDTNILIQSEYQRVVSKFSADGMDAALRCFGSQDTTGNCTIVPWPAVAQNYPWGYLAVGTSWYAPNGRSNPIVTALNTVYEIDVTANNGILTGTYCGETISTTYAGTLCNNLSITLFGNKLSSTNIQKSSSAKVRIYYYKLYTAENVLTANYIPAKRNSDNVLGMYDTISGAFFTNAGTGTFTAGNPVSDPVEIYTDGTVETIKDSLNNPATVEMLLKVGDYQDEQEILSGAVTRNVGVLVLDGTEDWLTSYTGFFNTALSNHIASASAYCNYFQSVITGTIPPAGERENKVWLGSTWLGLGARTKFSTVDDFKQFLADQYAAGTPVIVVYPLNASTTETVSPQKLLKNPVTVTEASIDNLEVTTTEAEHMVPTPDYPLGIVCNNGVLKVDPNNSVIVEGTPETVTITGKNLLDINKTSGAGYLNTSGGLVPYDAYYCSDYIEVKPSTVYTYTETMKSVVDGNYIRFCFYDSNKTFIYPRQGDTPTAEAKTYTYKITSPVNAKYIRISSHSDFVKGQLEEGIRPTKYEEYYQASFAPEDLLKLGDYQDVQNVLDGIVARNIGIKVLDGTEPWTRYGTGKFATPLIGSKKQDNQQAPIGSHFIGISYPNVPSEDGSMAVFNGSISSTRGALGINYQATPEVEQFKQWLADQYAAGTPVIVVYPLADTVEETVESRDVFITSGTNTIERNSEYVSSDGITVKYKKLR